MALEDSLRYKDFVKDYKSDKDKSQVVLTKIEEIRVVCDLSVRAEFSMLNAVADSIRGKTVSLLLDNKPVGCYRRNVENYSTLMPSMPYVKEFLVIVLFIWLLLLLYYNKKNYFSEVYVRMKDKYEQDIKKFKDLAAENESLNKEAVRQLTTMKDLTVEQLGYGKQIYEKVASGGQMKNISVEDEKCFVNYYAYTHPQKYVEMVFLYEGLSLRHTTYLILCDMGFTNPQIQNILFVQASTIRNYRLRIKRNEKKPKK